MELSIFNIPDDMFIFVIPYFLKYRDYISFITSSKIFKNLDCYYFSNKATIIKKFFKKYMYCSYYDLKGNNRKGYLANLKTIMNNKIKYLDKTIQLICAFQYDFRYIETGCIVEGKLILLQDAWVIYDEYYNKIHPFLPSFILKKSIRILS